MATFINDIQAALDSHLDSMDSTPIAWPNINYEPTTRARLICALGFYLSPLSKQAWVEAAKT
jgi:hypothetical protein